MTKNNKEQLERLLISNSVVPSDLYNSHEIDNLYENNNNLEIINFKIHFEDKETLDDLINLIDKLNKLPDYSINIIKKIKVNDYILLTVSVIGKPKI